MTPNAILQSLGQRLAGMTDCPPIVWPNEPAAPDKPYIVVQIVPGRHRDLTLKGGDDVIAEGSFVVVVVAELGGFSTDADTLAAAVMARFPKGLRTDGVLITEPARIGAGYTDDASYRVPVTISWSTMG